MGVGGKEGGARARSKLAAGGAQVMRGKRSSGMRGLKKAAKAGPGAAAVQLGLMQAASTGPLVGDLDTVG